MKFITVVLFTFCLSSAAANIYYISPSGSDGNGNGSLSNPWKTLGKATLTVTTAGDTIKVLPGTYTETIKSSLVPGVNLLGSGASSIIKSVYNAQWIPIIELSSPEGTNGNQFISNLYFDGSNYTTFWCLSIRGRSNVKVHDCSFSKFNDAAVMWAGKNDFTAGAPGIYATGNSFYNNTVTDCAYWDISYGRGAFSFGGQDGMQIYGNTMTETGRPSGMQGWPIKNCNEGHTKNCKINNNIIKRKPFPFPHNGDYDYWNFAIELFYEQGLEISNNVVEGSIDLNHQTKGNSAYSVYIHDNTIGFSTPAFTWESGIILEFSTEYAIIENNTIKNCMDAIEFSLRSGSSTNNISINHNLMYNIGITDGSHQGYAVRMITPDNYYSASNFKIINNTCISLPAPNDPYFGIDVPTGFASSNIKIQNNILQNFHFYAISATPGYVINGIAIQNNDLFNNGSNNGIQFANGAPLNYTNSGNISINPQLNAVYRPSPGSPVIDKGIYAGFAFNGTAPDIGYFESGIPNVPPAANAGADQIVTLPTNNTTLNGSGNDPDGNITTYSWTKIAGPAGGAITAPASAITSITGLALGVYKYELTVTDNNGDYGRDTVQVAVHPDPNIPPVANAGLDIVITLPVNDTTLNGSASIDNDGTITTYNWAKISGPPVGTLVAPASAITAINDLLLTGIYKFELTVTDNNGAVGKDTVQVIVNPNPANVAPIVNAGPDQTITLPINYSVLSATANDPDGIVTTYTWTRVAGPAAGNIANIFAPTTTVTNLVQGIYKFEVVVFDNDGTFARDTVQITVLPAPIAPTADAGSDQLINLPGNSTILVGSGFDPDGTITTYAWTKISGPAAGVISTPTAAATSISALTQGIYKFELEVTDNSGLSGKDTVVVIVNILPVANAGGDMSITFPVNSIPLNANASTDADGTIIVYGWKKISGPNAGNILQPNNSATAVMNMVAGVYKYELTVTDNYGAYSTDTVQAIVYAPNVTPLANAGLDISLTLPTNTVTLTGSGSDIDGIITGYLWTKVSGPGAGSITNSSSAVTTVTGLEAGTYVFELRVTDNNGGLAFDRVQVIVNPANIPPVANAGKDQTIVLPHTGITLTGSGTDVDGTVVSFLWRQIAGPADKIASPTTAVTALRNMVEGNYKFELTATDNKGAIGRDTVSVIVKAVTTVAALNTIRVYPNVITSTAILEVNKDNGGKPMLLIITDINGRVVHQKRLNPSGVIFKEALNFDTFATGLYFVTVHFSELEKQTVKTIKQND